MLGNQKAKWKGSAIKDILKITYLKKWHYLIAYHGNEVKTSKVNLLKVNTLLILI
jgi:hypothetical protein